MCGIVGAVAERDVTPILVEGLKRLEYRGYDSAGIAVMADDATIARCRTQGRYESSKMRCPKSHCLEQRASLIHVGRPTASLLAKTHILTCVKIP